MEARVSVVEKEPETKTQTERQRVAPKRPVKKMKPCPNKRKR